MITINPLLPTVSIVHKLPGRMRLRIPLIKKLIHTPYEHFLKDAGFFSFISGITEAKVDPITGNLLLEYDPNQLSEDTLLKVIKKLGAMIVRYRNEIRGVQPEHVPEVMNRIKQFLSSHDRIFQCKEILLPHDVWL